jgi:hypothetical protein
VTRAPKRRTHRKKTVSQKAPRKYGEAQQVRQHVNRNISERAYTDHFNSLKTSMSRHFEIERAIQNSIKRNEASKRRQFAANSAREKREYLHKKSQQALYKDSEERKIRDIQEYQQSPEYIYWMDPQNEFFNSYPICGTDLPILEGILPKEFKGSSTNFRQVLARQLKFQAKKLYIRQIHRNDAEKKKVEDLILESKKERSN